MKQIFSLLILCMMMYLANGQTPGETEDWSGAPEVVTPGNGTQPPSDATVLYGGAGDIEKWVHVEGGPPAWEAGDVLTVVPGSGDIQTSQVFGDVQLHVEWRTPEVIEGKGQGRGNSGVFLMGLYEVQVLDSYENETYSNGQAGAIYKQHIPLVNACRPPGVWQSFDIFFTAPGFREDGSLLSPAFITVVHNGVLIQNHVELLGPTLNIGKPRYEKHAERLPLMLQEHSNPVSYRNIWIREL
ncbi:MAG TPA: DUF1080 domain-containing protein [Bacteroides sp.]|nr:DUF1080 domain-containing protein [Bacteroides sp.]